MQNQNHSSIFGVRKSWKHMVKKASDFANPFENLPVDEIGKDSYEAERSTRGFLEKLVQDPITHSKFLNTISLLEHMGSRKILVSQSHSGTDESVLQHAAEEARHAYFFKKKTRLLDPTKRLQYREEDLYAGRNSVIYFQRLDAMVKRNLSRDPNLSKKQRSRLNYLYTTMLIEVRAFGFYNTYNQVLIENGIGFHLNGILREEEGHLREMTSSLESEDIEFRDRAGFFLEKESKYFRNLLQAWVNQINILSK